MKSKWQEYRSSLIPITITAFLAHGFLLIASGTWWDDWVYADKNWEYMLDVCKQSSLPLHAYINGFLWLLPDGFYRIITFFLFLGDALLLYYILKKIPAFEAEDALWIAILFSVIPINDARITWICFGYSLGLFLFLLSFSIGVLWKTFPDKGPRRVIFRLVSLLLLFISYDTESNMAMTPLILFFFYYMDLRDHWKESCCGHRCRQFLISVLKHADYLLAPFVWYFADKMLFPGYGVYSGHSYVVAASLPDIIKRSFLLSGESLKGLLHNYSYMAGKMGLTAALLCLIVLIAITNKKSQPKAENKPAVNKCLGMILLGCTAFYFGVFPYLIKRGQAVESVLILGRDSLLLGIGTAIIIYYAVKLLANFRVKRGILLLIVVLGIAHFNYYYMTWQECYYQQLQLRSEIENNEHIIDNDTFLVMFSNDVVSTHFYQINGNSWRATGTQNRFYMSGINDIQYLIDMDENSWILNAYCMRDYDYKDKTIDGIIFVDYHPAGSKVILKEKAYELFKKEEFEKWIDTAADIKYVPLSETDSDYIVDLFKEGNLTRDMLYNSYSK